MDKPLEHGLVDSVDGHPGEVSAHGLGPEGVPGQDGRVKVEQLNPVWQVAQPIAIDKIDVSRYLWPIDRCR